jgi:hypothetical protein
MTTRRDFFREVACASAFAALGSSAHSVAAAESSPNSRAERYRDSHALNVLSIMCLMYISFLLSSGIGW